MNFLSLLPLSTQSNNQKGIHLTSDDSLLGSIFSSSTITVLRDVWNLSIPVRIVSESFNTREARRAGRRAISESHRATLLQNCPFSYYRLPNSNMYETIHDGPADSPLLNMPRAHPNCPARQCLISEAWQYSRLFSKLLIRSMFRR